MRHARAGGAEVRTGFALAVNAHTHHVGIVVAVHTAVGPKVLHQFDALQHADAAGFPLPAVARVVGAAPHRAAAFGTPLPGFAHTPFAEIELDVAPRALQGFAHRAIAQSGLGPIFGSVAIVIFQQIDAPECILVGVGFLETVRAERTGTSFVGGVGVNAKFQPLAVHVVHSGFHAVGELVRIFSGRAVGIARRSVPKVVDDEVVVTGIFQAELIHAVGRRTNHAVGDVAFHHVPRNPAHHRTGIQIALVDREGDRIGDTCTVHAVGEYQVDVVAIGAGRGDAALDAPQVGVPGQTGRQVGGLDRGIGRDGLDPLHEQSAGSRKHAVAEIQLAVLDAWRRRGVGGAFLVGQ